MAVGLPPVIRVDGKLLQANYEQFTHQTSQRMVYDILTDEQIQKFESTFELDFSYALGRTARFRVNVFRDKGTVAAAFRIIPTKIPTLQDLGLPPVVEKLTHITRGLILVTGPTGSGKSTTLAAMINAINMSRSEHIITIEDPIEYLHNHKMSVINQRELGQDTKAFPNALRAALREDPDVILVGEMRDLETMQMAGLVRGNRPPGLRHPAHELGVDHRRPHRRLVPARASRSRSACSFRTTCRPCFASSSCPRTTSPGALRAGDHDRDAGDPEPDSGKPRRTRSPR
jgi:hypothetical protein